ncbi:hypothetical protein [Streptomyces erythrochromogenes]|uniref:hypothetical protein n=1 Tax=Streptomyces erythrochromogenes TaxID=285574 RepID=UPI003869AD9B|nr:hypothetical protein OG364_06185 [Streptomyces erythrochromogenes]
MDKVFDDLPTSEELRRGHDITPKVHTVVGDLSVILTEACEELVTGSRYETQKLTHYNAYERFGTASLAQCAIPLGTALAHLSHVVDRLGFLHENIRHSSTGRTAPPDDVRMVIQAYLDLVGTDLRMAAQQLRGKSTEISRMIATRSAVATNMHTAVPPTSALPTGRTR